MPLNKVAVTALLLGALTGEGRADDPGIARLDGDRLRLSAQRDSLLRARGEVVGEVARLSAAIDSLKADPRGREGGALQAALRQSLRVSGRLDGVNRVLEGLQADLEATTQRLRAAYDREIDTLTRRPGFDRDASVARRVRDYRRAREALQPEAVPVARDLLEGLTLREADGPEDIRQKADLLADGAARLAAEATLMDRRLRKMETERRLRSRASAFAQEMDTFDESLPEGRAVSSSSQRAADAPPKISGVAPPGAVQLPSAPVAGGEEQGRPPTERPFAGREAAGQGGGTSPGEPLPGADLDAEIRQLQARRREALELQRALAAKAEAFRARLLRMLEERN